MIGFLISTGIGLILVPVTYLLLFVLLLLIIFVITLFFNKNKDIKKFYINKIKEA